MMTGAERIADERQRQVEQKAYSPEGDDAYASGELARAAVCFAAPVRVYEFGQPDDISGESGSCNARIDTLIRLRDPWPFEDGAGCTDKRESYDDDRGAGIVDNCDLAVEHRINLLVRAGALIAAEIDRLERQKARS